MPAVLSVIVGIFLCVVSVILLVYGWVSRDFVTHVVHPNGKSTHLSGKGETVLVAIGVIAGIIQFVLSVARIIEFGYIAIAAVFFIAAVLAKLFILGGALVMEAVMFLYYGSAFILPEETFAKFSDALPVKLIAVLCVVAAVVYGIRMTINCKEERW